MYNIHQEVIARNIGLCTVRGRTYEMRPRYLLIDRRGRSHVGVPAEHIRPCQAQILELRP